MFAGGAGVELESEKRIEKIIMASHALLTPPNKNTPLKT